MSLLDQLAGSSLQQKARNVYMTGELLRLLTVFESRGIPAISYKGPLLAAFAYGKLAYRQFSDLDILVHKRHFPRIRALMEAQGYEPLFNLTPSQETAYFQRHQEFPFQRPKSGMLVEIQWRIEARYFSFGLDLDHLLPRAERTSLGGKDVLTLSPSDLLLIICVHSAKHLCLRLGWICDIAELIRRHKQLDWDGLLREARHWGAERFLLLGVSLAGDLLDAPIPKDVLAGARSCPEIAAHTRHVCKHLFRDDLGLFRNIGDALFQLRLSERLSDRIRYILDLAVTPAVPDLQAIALPAPLSFLYYFLRPVRLAGKYLRQIAEPHS